MINRYFNISRDFHKLNDFEKEDKEKVINWSRTTFYNQWKIRGEEDDG